MNRRQFVVGVAASAIALALNDAKALAAHGPADVRNAPSFGNDWANIPMASEEQMDRIQKFMREHPEDFSKIVGLRITSLKEAGIINSACSNRTCDINLGVVEEDVSCTLAQSQYSTESRKDFHGWEMHWDNRSTMVTYPHKTFALEIIHGIGIHEYLKTQYRVIEPAYYDKVVGGSYAVKTKNGAFMRVCPSHAMRGSWYFEGKMGADFNSYAC